MNGPVKQEMMERVAEAYNAGELTVMDIAVEFQLNERTIYRVLRKLRRQGKTIPFRYLRF